MVFQAVPVGAILPYGGTTAPVDWLLCDGTEFKKADYPELVAIIGTAYDNSPAAGNFNVPDLKGRAPIGAGTGAGLTARTLGQKVGDESTILTEAHMPDGQVNSGAGTEYVTAAGTKGTASAGGATAVPHMGPSTVVNFIIKAKGQTSSPAERSFTRLYPK